MQPAGSRWLRPYRPRSETSLSAAEFFVVAVSTIDSVVPSGSLKLNVTFSPSFGLTAPRSTVTAGGAPAGCVTVAPVSDELIEPSFNPNDEPSSARLVTVVVNGGDETVRWPMLPTP